jgi:hypothetical protein
MMCQLKPVLVTGSHRSGTTWIGQTLAFAPHTGYIHEPFNPDITYPTVEKTFPFWFQHISDHNETLHRAPVEQLMAFHYPLLANLYRSQSVKGFAYVLSECARTTLNRLSSSVPIVKDPIAFFSAEWLSHSFNMNVLVSIRHPAAFCSSLKLKNWSFDFNTFLKQPLLMKSYLSTFHDEISEFSSCERPIIEQAILLWRCIHKTVLIYQERHPEWLYVRHEDLSLDPVFGFRELYASLGLEYSSTIEARIIKSSGAHNPTEQVPGNEYIRDSISNIRNWTRRLTFQEIDLVRCKTESISCSFYSDDDW